MIKIYTDGACSGNPGPGGSAYIIIKGEEIVYKRLFSFPLTTNNFCELFAVIESIRYVINNDILECEIFSDSKYVVDGINLWMNKWINNDWRGSSNHKIKNIEIWQNLYLLWNTATSISNISIHYVKGHSTNNYNKIVDKLAKQAIRLNGNNEE